MATEDLQPREPREVVHNPQEKDITTAAAAEEGHSVDELARGLATGRMSRRRVLKVLGGTLAGGLLAVFGVGGGVAAAHECKRNGKACKKDSQCCSGICSSGTCAACRPNSGSCTANTQCCSGNCSGGTCTACPSGRVLLSNGTCALPCSSDCPDCSSVGRPNCGEEADTGGAFCIGDPTTDTCTTTNDCPTGQFCLNAGGAVHTCRVAC
jgi:hypothetical protein